MRLKKLFQARTLLAVSTLAAVLILYFSLRLPSSLYMSGSMLASGILSGLSPLDMVHAREIGFPKGDNPLIYVKPAFFIGILLLLGAGWYVKSGYKEIRLIRFGFSIILGIKAMHVLTYAIIIMIGIVVENPGTNYLLSLAVNMFFSFCWAWYSYQALKIWAQERSLRTIEIETDGTLQPVLVNAERIQRVAHFVVDIALITFFIAPPLAELVMSLTEYSISGNRITVLAALLLYYGFYETLLQASPAKMLTATQVTDAEGNQPNLSTILKRSLLRFIPLEGLSFLKNSGSGIHDAWSDTYVVKEEIPE